MQHTIGIHPSRDSRNSEFKKAKVSVEIILASKKAKVRRPEDSLRHIRNEAGLCAKPRSLLRLGAYDQDLRDCNTST